MGESEQRTTKRKEALSAAGIVQTAIEILDTDGEDALTFRSLAARLSTGAGAIYHHVANKNELLEAAATELVGETVIVSDGSVAPGTLQQIIASDKQVRSLMLKVFDLLDAHRWLGSQLVREPWQTAVLLIFEAIGKRLVTMGIPDDLQFEVASALVHYLLGAAGQYAASARIPSTVDRSAFLTTVAKEWMARAGQEKLPFVHAMADQLTNHDDRQQFLAGVDLILAGAALTQNVRRPVD